MEKDQTFPTLNNIKIGDSVQVYCEEEDTYLDAKIIEIKKDSENSGEQYYIHFLNYEKRMDRWIGSELINKNYSNRNKKK